MNSLQGQTLNDTLLHNLLRDVNHFQLNFQMLFHIFLQTPQTHFSFIFFITEGEKMFWGRNNTTGWKCCEVLYCSNRGNSHTCWSYREKSECHPVWCSECTDWSNCNGVVQREQASLMIMLTPLQTHSKRCHCRALNVTAATVKRNRKLLSQLMWWYKLSMLCPLKRQDFINTAKDDKNSHVYTL